MTHKLEVYLRDRLVGRYFKNKNGRPVFEYDDGWLKAPGAAQLSRTLPTTKKRFTPNETRPFFAGILPEQEKRKVIAKNLGVSAENDFSLLNEIGGECAGAVTFLPAGQGLPVAGGEYREITGLELAQIFRELPKRPLMAGDEGIRLSLAGAQDKMTVRKVGNKLSIPLNGSPSTHIIKPAITYFDGVVFNEAYCMRLAGAIGLKVANVEVGSAEGIDYLLVERYDRVISKADEGAILVSRLHQEDFCQALGVVPERKYQKEGGPSLKQSFDLVREATLNTVVDLVGLLKAVIFNYLIGNHDAHGKNFSLLYREDGKAELAPLYDVLSTSYYPTHSMEMAMKFGKTYRSSEVSATDFEQCAEETGLGKMLFKYYVIEVAKRVIAELPNVYVDERVSPALAKQIQSSCERTIGMFKK